MAKGTFRGYSALFYNVFQTRHTHTACGERRTNTSEIHHFAKDLTFERCPSPPHLFARFMRGCPYRPVSLAPSRDTCLDTIENPAACTGRAMIVWAIGSAVNGRRPSLTLDRDLPD